jgi:cytosine permease
VAKVATFLPLIPLAILLILLAKTLGGIGSFDAQKFVAAGIAANKGQGSGLDFLGVMALSMSFVIGFFATAGAAGVDFGTNSKDEKDVQMGGLMGIALATIVSAGAAILIAAGAFGATGKYAMNPADTGFMGGIMGSDGTGTVMSLLLAVAAFPSACFSAFIAANSFKTTLPTVNPFISVGIGTIVSIILAVTGWAGRAGAVFTVIGASFGPICGAMLVDYVLAGKKWAGPRPGWNVAGWVSWAVGFIVGIAPLIKKGDKPIADIPAAPLVAFIVGAVVYFVLAKAGLQSAAVDMPGGQKTPKGAPA